MESRLVGAVILLALRGIAWGYYFAPPFLKRLLGKGLGALLRRLKIRSGVVRQNLELAFPPGDPARERIFREAYEHLGNLAFEILMVLGPIRRFALENGELSGIENWNAAKRLGKGVILLASHVGNWEMMTATGALHHGIDILLVTKHLKPEWLHRAIEKGRLSCGARATYEPKTLRDVLAHLKANGTVGIVLDQYAGPPVGVRVPVFGVPVSTTTAVAALAKRTGATVLPVVNYRTPEGRFRVEIRPPAPWQEFPEQKSASYDLAANTAAYAKSLEGDIYAHPGQWLWIHRRFKGDLSPLREGEWNEGRARR